MRVKSAAVPDKRKRKQTCEGFNHVVTLNYENLPWLLDTYEPGKIPFDYLVCDEVDYLKNPSTVRFKALKRRLDEFKIRIGMTGSFSSEGLLDVFGPAYVVSNGELLGRSFSKFKSKYFESDYNGWKYTPRLGAVEQVVDKLAPVTFRADATDHLDLPPLTVVDQWFDLPPKARRAYDKLEQEFQGIIEAGGTLGDLEDENENEFGEVEGAPPTSAAVLKNKLRQICAGFLYYHEEDEDGLRIGERQVQKFHDAKFEMHADLLGELMGKQLLTIYGFKYELERLGEMPYLGGGVKDSDANRWITEWNEGKISRLALHPASAAHGLNLQTGGAHHLAFLTLPWSNNRYRQVLGRLQRLGQKNPVIVHRFLATDTVDADVAQALEDKQNVQTSVLQRIKERTRNVRTRSSATG